MKKILFVHHAKGWGGAPINMVNIINHLDKDKYQPMVLLLKNSIVCQKLQDNKIPFTVAKSWFYRKFYTYFTHSDAGYTKWYQLIRLGILALNWLLSRYLFSSKELNRLDFDIVHLNSSVLSDWLAPCKKIGKVVIHIQEPVSKGLLGIRYSFFKLQMQKYADHIIAISKDNADRIGIPKKTTIVYNFFDDTNSNVDQQSYSSKKFLYLGGASKMKGFYTMVDALNYLDNDIIIFFGGNYNINANGKKLINFLKRLSFYNVKKQNKIKAMRSNIHAVEIGLISNVTKYINEACCLISPFSKPHFSRPVIEAQLLKKPSISSDLVGIKEIIEPNFNGVLFEADNPKELGNAINYLASKPEISRRLGEQGYHEAVQKFTSNNVAIIEGLYHTLLS